MRSKILLISILIYTAISRFVSADDTIYHMNNIHIFIVLLSLINLLLLYYYVKMVAKSTKIAIISAFMYAVLPWAVVQGNNIVSQMLFSVLLIILTISQKAENNLMKVFIFITVLIGFLFINRSLFVWNNYSWSPDFRLIKNLFIFTSPEFLFSQNKIYLSFIPYLYMGIYQLLIKRKWHAIIWLLTVLLSVSFKPTVFYKQNYIIFLPFVFLILASGVVKTFDYFRQERLICKGILSFLFLLAVYDFFQYQHYFFFHFPHDLQKNSGIFDLFFKI